MVNKHGGDPPAFVRIAQSPRHDRPSVSYTLENRNKSRARDCFVQKIFILFIFFFSSLKIAISALLASTIFVIMSKNFAR